MKQNIVFAVLSVLLRGAVRIVSVLLTLTGVCGTVHVMHDLRRSE